MIEQLVNEINGLLRDGYPYSALGIALTLPDICGNIAYPNTKVADHYKKWYSEYVNPISALKFKDGFDEEICYKLRCAYLHSGNFDADDQAVVKRLLPDSLGDYAEMLPILDIGEALIVGDASLLPSRIRIAPPKLKPRSATIDFWDEWAKETSAVNIRNAIEALRKQSK